MSGRWSRAWDRRRLLAEAAVALLCANIRVRTTRGARLAQALGQPQPTAMPILSPVQLRHARDVGWAIELLAVRGPLRTECLGQALAARRLLQRRQVPCRLTVGLGRAPDGRLRAHAWLQAGAYTVTGGQERRAFSALAGFQ
jgi:hypothetical protein